VSCLQCQRLFYVTIREYQLSPSVFWVLGWFAMTMLLAMAGPTARPWSPWGGRVSWQKLMKWRSTSNGFTNWIPFFVHLSNDRVAGTRSRLNNIGFYTYLWQKRPVLASCHGAWTLVSRWFPFKSAGYWRMVTSKTRRYRRIGGTTSSRSRNTGKRFTPTSVWFYPMNCRNWCQSFHRTSRFDEVSATGRYRRRFASAAG